MVAVLTSDVCFDDNKLRQSSATATMNATLDEPSAVVVETSPGSSKCPTRAR